MPDDQAIWEVPIKRILLLMREKVYLESDRPGIQLSTMEWIDNKSRTTCNGITARTQNNSYP